jgi:hypothetical protein
MIWEKENKCRSSDLLGEPWIALASQPAAIAELRSRLERMTAHGSEREVLPFDVKELDDHLPGGGLCRGHLHEIIKAGPASEHAAIASIFAAGLRSSNSGVVPTYRSLL